METEQDNLTPEKISRAAEAMMEARTLYEQAVEAMKLLEAQRGMLVGTPFNTSKAMGMVQRLLPKVLKIGGMFAGGGGITALMADPGAFAGIISKLGGLFGG